jgi:transposase InsO family protein
MRSGFVIIRDVSPNDSTKVSLAEPRSPRQNAYVERLVGSVRRECVDQVVVLGERHLRHVLLSYMKYYNETRTHLSLNKDAPIPRAVQAAGRILCLPIVGGLHHQYGRI